MIISLVGKGSRTLLADLDAAGVAYETRPIQPGVIMNAGDAVKILEIAIPAVAAVLVAWVKYAPTRKVMITLPDRSIVQAEGRSVAEIEQVLTVAKQVMVMDAKNPDSHTK
jgi:hypothetical protein